MIPKNLLIFSLVFFVGYTVHAQCNSNFSIGDDTVLCGNSSFMTSAPTGYSSYQWNTGDTSANILITAPGTYICTVEDTSDNLIVNGDFSNGNTGFSSDYTYAPQYISYVTGPGNYYLGANANAIYANYQNCNEHTSGGGGQMMVIDGYTTMLNQALWQETVTVAPNTTYYFSMWATNVSSAPDAMLEFFFNNVSTGGILDVSTPSCFWHHFTITWNSGNNTSLTIKIVDNATSYGGNDFAIDDLSLIGICSYSDTMHVSGDVHIAVSNDTAICVGDTAQLSASGTGVFTWSPASGLSNPNISNPLAYPNHTQTYHLTFDGIHGCHTEDSVMITVLPRPMITVSVDSPVCVGQDLHLSAHSESNNSYQWTGPNGYHSTDQNPVINHVEKSASGNYIVTAENALGCRRSESVHVEIYGLPNLKIIADSMNKLRLCMGDTVHLKGSGAVAYHWWSGDGIDYGNRDYANVNIAAQSDLFKLVGYGEHGCIDTTQIVLNAKACCQIFVPNAFTPNGDGLNDKFRVETIGHPQRFRLQIYNRWGQLVFVSFRPSDGWNGTYMNTKADLDTYYYYVSGVCADGEPFNQKGSLSLIR